MNFYEFRKETSGGIEGHGEAEERLVDDVGSGKAGSSEE